MENNINVDTLQLIKEKAMKFAAKSKPIPFEVLFPAAAESTAVLCP